MDERVPHTSSEEVLTTQGDGPHKRRMPAQELIRHVLKLCGAEVLQGRAPRGNTAGQPFGALTWVQKGTEKGAMRWRWQTECLVAKTAEQLMEGQAPVRLGASKKQETIASLNWLRC